MAGEASFWTLSQIQALVSSSLSVLLSLSSCGVFYFLPFVSKMVFTWTNFFFILLPSSFCAFSVAALSLRFCASVLQVQTLQEVVLEKEANLAAREKQLLQDLEESRAGEQCLKDSLNVLEAEMSELHLRLCSTENRAKALATECQQANNAHCEAQSQLDKLHLVLHHMLCDSTDKNKDIAAWSSGKCWRDGNYVECLGMEDNIEGGGTVLCNPNRFVLSNTDCLKS